MTARAPIRWVAAALAGGALVSGAACGDPAWNGDYQGRIMSEQVCASLSFEAPPAVQHRIGLVWLTWDDDGALTLHAHDTEQVAGSIASPMRIYAAPSADVMVPFGGARVAVGQYIDFDDVDGDGLRDDGETINAVAREQLVVFVDGELHADPWLGTVGRGYAYLGINHCLPYGPVVISSYSACVLSRPEAGGVGAFFPYGCQWPLVPQESQP